MKTFVLSNKRKDRKCKTEPVGRLEERKPTIMNLNNIYSFEPMKGVTKI